MTDDPGHLSGWEPILGCISPRGIPPLCNVPLWALREEAEAPPTVTSLPYVTFIGVKYFIYAKVQSLFTNITQFYWLQLSNESFDIIRQ